MCSEKVAKPSRRRPLVKYLEQSYRVSERHACCVLEVARATYRYKGYAEQWIELRMRIREIAQTRVRYGYRMIRVLLNRGGWKVGKDLVYRLYKEEGLGLRKRPAGRRRAVVHRQERFKPTGPNQVWAMDFVSDQLCDGRRFRALTVVDIYTRESLTIEAGQNLRGEDVVRVLNRLKLERRVPKALFCDNGSEFTGQMMDRLSPWGKDRLLPARKADRQRLLRVVQRNLPGRVSGHQLVPNSARSKASHRAVAARI
jgi:putative transposase